MELRPDVSLVVVVNDKEQVLVIRRSELSSDTGRWESPVGHRDSGETAREAALREVKEETGLTVTLFPESFEKKNPDGKTIAVFMAKADTEEVKLEPKEHDSFKWLTLKEVADLSPTHPSYKSDVRKIIKMNAATQEKEAMSIGRGYLPPQLRQNNYLATYPLGARMPAKPNPAAQVKPKAIKADAQGVQAAMNKRGAEEKKEHTAKMKTNDWSTGNAAIDSLKEHMRKSGFDSFQMSFFTRLAEQGYTAEQVKQAVAKVESIDKEAADSLKSGFEKIANPWLSAAMRAGSGIKNQLPGIGKAIWNGGKGAIGKVRGNIASLQSSATKAPLTTAKALAPRAGIGAVAGAANPTAPDASTAFSDPLGYASRVAPHMAAGALTTTIGGKPATRFAQGAVSGFGTGQGTGMVTDALGYTNNARVNLGNAGWGLGGLGSASRIVKPETLAKFDPITLGAKGIQSGLNSNAAKFGLPAAGLLGGGYFIGDSIQSAAEAANPFNPANKDKAQQMMSDALSSNKDFQGAVSGLNNATSSVANAANSFGETAKSWQPGSLLGGQGGGGNGLGDMFGNLGQTFKDNPWLLPMLLSGLGGAGAGYAMGGGGGAMLGGLGLPLIMYLLSQRNSQQAGAAPPTNPAVQPALPPASTLPQRPGTMGEPDLGAIADNMKQ